MYSIIRLLIGGIFLLCAIIVIKKSNAVKKKMLVILSAIGAVVLTTALAFVPFENLFVTFHSPEAAYGYFTGETNIKIVVEGQQSDYVVGGSGDKNVSLIVPKTEDGWKVGIGADTKLVSQSIQDGIVLYVYRYQNTNEYYLTVFDTNGGTSEITDCLGSEFYPVAQANAALDKEFVTYYSYLPNPDPSYWISVNNITITPFEE